VWLWKPSRTPPRPAKAADRAISDPAAPAAADHAERDRDYATVEGTGLVPVTLADEQDHAGDVPPEGMNYWEEYASGLVGETADGEHDVFLWNAAYIVKGPREGRSIWIGRDFREHDTALPSSRRSGAAGAWRTTTSRAAAGTSPSTSTPRRSW